MAGPRARSFRRGLAGALTDRDDGDAMLEELEGRDLLLQPLDDEREWFRYHPLLADVLRARLSREGPERTGILNRRAAHWLAAHDLVSAAVTHALAAGDAELATDIVERRAMSWVEHSRMATLLSMTARLPGNVVDRRPTLLMAVAWANCLLRRPEPAQLAVDRLRRVISDDVPPEMRSEADVVQACIDIHNDRTGPDPVSWTR